MAVSAIINAQLIAVRDFMMGTIFFPPRPLLLQDKSIWMSSSAKRPLSLSHRMIRWRNNSSAFIVDLKEIFPRPKREENHLESFRSNAQHDQYQQQQANDAT